MKNRVRAHPGQHLAAKGGPRAHKMRPRRAQEAPKSVQERPKTAQEPPKRRPGDAQTPPKPAPERSRTSFSRALGRNPCPRSCGAVFFWFFVSRAGCPTCSDVRSVPLLPVFCKVRSIHATVAREHAKAVKNLEKCGPGASENLPGAFRNPPSWPKLAQVRPRTAQDCSGTSPGDSETSQDFPRRPKTPQI